MLLNQAVRSAKSIFLGLFFSFTLIATSQTPVNADTTKKANPKHILWEMKTPTTTVWFLGSIHMLKKGFYPLPHKVREVFKKSKRIVFEANMKEANEPEFQKKMLLKALYPQGDSLKKHISSKTYNRAVAALKKIPSLANTKPDPFKPWMVSLMISSEILRQEGYESTLGIDHTLFFRALKQKKRVFCLETVAQQLDFFDTLSPANQELFLIYTILEADAIGTAMNQIVEKWKQGNDKALEELLNEGFEKVPEIYTPLIVKRNKAWLPKLIKLGKKTDPALVVVGALHLVGENSVINLLEKKGFSIKRL